MLVIDGSFGEGGGQILRSALALSLVTQTPFRIEKIRRGRQKPGLMRQHLAAVRAAAEIGAAELRGAELGSQELSFTPKAQKTGAFRFAVGSAGSATLVLQTVLPALWAAAAPSTVVVEGGTHNPMAPPFDFLALSYLPLLARMGPQVTATLERPGFYPAGGGAVTAVIAPASSWARLDLPARGALRAVRARAWVVNLPFHIAEREATVLRERLELPEAQCRAERSTDGHGPGNYLRVEIESEHLTEVVSGVGAKGVSAEQVAEQVATEAGALLSAGVPVGEHLADQLLLPMALGAGGSFLTVAPSLHTTTHAALLRRFVGAKIRIEEAEAGRWHVEVAPRAS